MTTLAAYTKLERIGRGSYGEVFKVRRHSDGTTLVLKEVSMVGITEQEEREIMNETSCMVQLSHPNIIAFVGSFLERGALHIVMEFASGGDLQCLIRRHVQTGTFLSEDRLWKFLIQLSQGLQHAHSRRILHRDIKASNVFIDANDDIKIGDLGLGKILVESRCALSQVGTPIYMSPEMCEGRPYDTKSDVWALGCLMFELATLKPPFQAPNQALLARKIINDAPDTHVPSHYSREIPFIVNKLLDKEPRRRPSPDSILNYSAVQIRLERTRFQAREAELLAQLHEAKQKETRRAMEHASAVQSALQEGQRHQKQQTAEQELHSEIHAEREKMRVAQESLEKRERAHECEREEWRQREAVLVQRCEALEREKSKEREDKEAALQQLQLLQRMTLQCVYGSEHMAPANSHSHEDEPHSLRFCTPTSAVSAAAASWHKEEGEEGNSSGTSRKHAHRESQEDSVLLPVTPGCGEPIGSAVRTERWKADRERGAIPMPTPSNLFISPHVVARGPHPVGVHTPSRLADKKGILDGVRRTPLTRRSWGEDDAMRLGSCRPDACSATPLRGPLRASVDSSIAAWECGSKCRGRMEELQENGGCAPPWKGSSDKTEVLQDSENPGVEKKREQGSRIMDDICASDSSGEKGAAVAAELGVPCGGDGRDAELGDDSVKRKTTHGAIHAQTPPSVSMVAGCIRARQRTPQTSLGPAKRVPVSERVPSQESTPAQASRTRGTLAKKGSRLYGSGKRDGRGLSEAESDSPSAKLELQLPFSRSSPKSARDGQCAGRQATSSEDDELARSVADILALTEGLRRSAQIALNASSSSGSDLSPTPSSGHSPPGSIMASARRLEFLPSTS